MGNQVQIAHGVVIGAGCAIADQSGIAGSSVLGDGVMLGGRAGVGDHVTLAPDTVLAAASVTTRDLIAGVYFGTPAYPRDNALRAAALHDRLPELFARLWTIEDKLSGADH